VVRTELGYGAKGLINIAGYENGPVFDPIASVRKLIELDVVSWNFLGPDGQPVPVGPASVFMLDDDTAQVLGDICSQATAAKDQPLPNDLGAPLQDSSQASASPTPATPTPKTSTTS